MMLLALYTALIADPGSITINGPGITYHGYLQPGAYDMMKHKLGKNTVWHPVELGAIYKKDNLQFGADFMKDCFGHKAGTLYIGPKVDFWSYFSAGGMFGTYVRESMHGGALPLVKTVKGVDIMPMAGATLSVSVPVTKRVAIEANSLINFYDNHANLGLKFGF